MPVDSHPAASVRAAALKRFPLGLVLDHEVHGPAGQNMGQPLKVSTHIRSHSHTALAL